LVKRLYLQLQTGQRRSQSLLRHGYKRLNRFSRGVLGIVIRALETFIAARTTQAAASIAYYALFSLFPLLLLLITFGTTVLKNERTVEWVLGYTQTVLPTAQDLVRRNIEGVLALRGPVGIVAGLGLLWSATNVFDILVRNISLAWPEAEPQTFLRRRLVGLVIISILMVILLLSVLSSTLFRLLPWLDSNGSLWGGVPLYETLPWKLAAGFVPWVLAFLMFLGLYRWVPTVKVGWSAAIWGAIVAALAWEVTKSGFSWFLGSGLAQYQLVYGSLATVVALMLWIYLSSLIILFGAHLSGAISGHHKRQRNRS
jgi:membrane protein